ncbi:hemerythrin domain-containing protein [Micromonospora sp. NBC_01699]|uniref:hemerythrin domain-containing protein n=1 Tax=Micromonospora sp. NBC_01699 TaxID=2975984 RepID=UPI002E358B9B|nr:hemerythrin domain-containing protein [Micromonospora sp. NBC_01699]
MGTALKLVHDAFRRELALVRQEVAGAGTALGAQLRMNCLTVCRGLAVHHTGEDTGVFPALVERHPALAPTVARLRREHETIAALVEDLRAVVVADRAEPVSVLAEVDRLVAELERHLTYEEERLIPVLDAPPVDRG